MYSARFFFYIWWALVTLTVCVTAMSSLACVELGRCSRRRGGDWAHRQLPTRRQELEGCALQSRMIPIWMLDGRAAPRGPYIRMSDAPCTYYIIRFRFLFWASRPPCRSPNPRITPCGTSSASRALPDAE